MEPKVEFSIHKNLEEIQKRQDLAFEKQQKNFNKQKIELKQQREELRLQHDNLLKTLKHNQDSQLQYLAMITEKIEKLKHRKKLKMMKMPLEESKKQVESNREVKCIVCFENLLELAFLPCGHVCTCQKCGLELMNECPICRKKIFSSMKIFFP